MFFATQVANDLVKVDQKKAEAIAIEYLNAILRQFESVKTANSPKYEDISDMQRGTYKPYTEAEELANRSTVNLDFGGSEIENIEEAMICLLYTSPSPRDRTRSRMPSSA